MATAPEIREHLVRALHADLIGPFDLDNPLAEETLRLPPSRWYLAGFLAPEHDRDLPDEDPTAEEELDAGTSELEEDGTHEPEAKPKKRLPASLGLTVLLPAEAGRVSAQVAYAEYESVTSQVEGESRAKRFWQRRPRQPDPIDMPLDSAALERGIEVPDSRGVFLTGRLVPVDSEHLPSGTHALSVFVVNRRPSDVGARDERFIFQVALTLRCDAGFVPRANRTGEESEDWDDRVSDLQYRDDEASSANVVWTGPDAQGTTVRETRHVLRELFESASESVLIAGFRFDHGKELFRPLVERDVDVEIFLDVPEADHQDHVAATVSTFANDFLQKNWPARAKPPGLYYDPRSVSPAVRASLHAKAVVVDTARALVGSANFTDRGQTRNIELGLRVDDPAVAQDIVAQFRRLVSAGRLVRV